MTETAASAFSSFPAPDVSAGSLEEIPNFLFHGIPSVRLEKTLFWWKLKKRNASGNVNEIFPENTKVLPRLEQHLYFKGESYEKVL